jgi:hypothetical protein
MDPDKALAELRELLEMLSGRDGHGKLSEDDVIAMINGVVEHFDGLDQWLSHGGALPRAWSR